MAFTPRGLQARIDLSGTLVYKNKAGEVIKTVSFTGGIPIKKLGLNEAQARELVAKHQEKAK